MLPRVFPELTRLLPAPDELAGYYRFAINGETITVDMDYALTEGDRVILFSATVGG